MFRSFIKPRVARFVELAHRHGVKFMFRSCGAIRPVIDDLIEIGVDILDPLQAAAAMEPERPKADFGRRICLHGGIDTQYLLPQGSPHYVRREVQRRIEILGEEGGYKNVTRGEGFGEANEPDRTVGGAARSTE